MSKKVYRTAQGKSLDIGALQLQNESVRAVGNMGVNARGDRVGPQNNTVDGRTQKITRQYKKQINRTNVSDDVVHASKKAAKKQATAQPAPQPEPVLEMDAPVVEPAIKPTVAKPEDSFETEVTVEAEVTEQVEQPAPEPQVQVHKNSKPVGGLADAIAKAKNVKQEPLKTPRQEARERKGVKKI